MKLWVLTGSYHVIVVRAETEAAARMVKKQEEMKRWGDDSGDIYLDPEEYTCEEITVDGEPEVIAEHSG